MVKIIETLTTTEDVKDVKGWTIPKNTRLGIVKKSGVKHPEFGHEVVVIRVDNGTVGIENELSGVKGKGEWDLCPETAIYMKDGKLLSSDKIYQMWKKA